MSISSPTSSSVGTGREGSLNDWSSGSPTSSSSVPKRKLKRLQSAHQDVEHGLWICKNCDHRYPSGPHPSAHLRKIHKRECPKRSRGLQEVVIESIDDSESLGTSKSEESVRTGDNEVTILPMVEHKTFSDIDMEENLTEWEEAPEDSDRAIADGPKQGWSGEQGESTQHGIGPELFDKDPQGGASPRRTLKDKEGDDEIRSSSPAGEHESDLRHPSDVLGFDSVIGTKDDGLKQDPSGEPTEATRQGSEAHDEKGEISEAKELHSVHVPQEDTKQSVQEEDSNDDGLKQVPSREPAEAAHQGNDAEDVEDLQGKGLHSEQVPPKDSQHSQDVIFKQAVQEEDSKDERLKQGPSGEPTKGVHQRWEGEDEKREVLEDKELQLPPKDSQDSVVKQSAQEEDSKDDGQQQGPSGEPTERIHQRWGGEDEVLEDKVLQLPPEDSQDSVVKQSVQEEDSNDDGLKQVPSREPAEAAHQGNDAEDVEDLQGKGLHSEQVPPKDSQHSPDVIFKQAVQEEDSKDEGLTQGPSGEPTKGVHQRWEGEDEKREVLEDKELQLPPKDSQDSVIKRSVQEEDNKDDGLKQGPSGEPTEGVHQRWGGEDEVLEDKVLQLPPEDSQDSVVKQSVPEEDSKDDGLKQVPSREPGEAAHQGNDAEDVEDLQGKGLHSEQVPPKDSQHSQDVIFKQAVQEEDSKDERLKKGPSGEPAEAGYQGNEAEDEKVEVSEYGAYPKPESSEEVESGNESRCSSAAVDHDTDYFDPSDDTGLFEGSDMGEASKEECSLHSDDDMFEEDKPAKRVGDDRREAENRPSYDVGSGGISESGEHIGHVGEITESPKDRGTLLNVANFISQYESGLKGTSDFEGTTSSFERNGHVASHSLRNMDSKEVGEITIEADDASISTAYMYDVAKMLREQKTHDLICPICGSQITKRIIIRKKRRAFVSKGPGRLPNLTDITSDISEEENRKAHIPSFISNDATWLDRCFSYLGPLLPPPREN